jgi:hypothetical protein
VPPSGHATSDCALNGWPIEESGGIADGGRVSDRPRFEKDPEAALAAALSDEALDALERRTGDPEPVEVPDATATWEAGAGLSARELRGAWKRRR